MQSRRCDVRTSLRSPTTPMVCRSVRMGAVATRRSGNETAAVTGPPPTPTSGANQRDTSSIDYICAAHLPDMYVCVHASSCVFRIALTKKMYIYVYGRMYVCIYASSGACIYTNMF